jgi:actin-related protein
MVGEPQATPIVVDVGTDLTKIGFAGEKIPRAVVRTLFGKNKDTKVDYFGDDVLPYIDTLRLRTIVDNGYIGEDARVSLAKYLNYLMETHLKVNPRDHPLLFLINGKGVGEWETIATACFSDMGVPALNIMRSSMAVLTTVQKPTSMILQIGAGHCIIGSFLNYYGTQRTIGRYAIGAKKDVDEVLFQQLVKSGKLPNKPSSREEVRRIKEQICYTALDFEEEKRKAEKHENIKTVTLQNGKQIDCDIERIVAPEVLFNPTINNSNIVGIHQWEPEVYFYYSMHADFSHSKEDWYRELLKNIFVVGGHVQMPGFKERLQKELELRYPSYEIEVKIPENAAVCEWTGGSLIADKGKINWVTNKMWADAKESYRRAANPGWGGDGTPTGSRPDDYF